MSDNGRRAGDGDVTKPEAYVPPALEVLGSVEALTQGPTPDAGDVPTGVIFIS
jgi:hypothetical protein